MFYQREVRSYWEKIKNRIHVNPINLIIKFTLNAGPFAKRFCPVEEEFKATDHDGQHNDNIDIHREIDRLLPAEDETHNEILLKKINPDLIEAIILTEPKVNKQSLINLLSYIIFSNEYIYIHFRNGYCQDYLLKVKPSIYRNGHVVFPCDVSMLMSHDRTKAMHLLINNQNHLILVPIECPLFTGDAIEVSLPEMAYSYSKRHVKRYLGVGVLAKMSQGNVTVWGSLIDFNPCGFRIKMQIISSNLMPELPVFLTLIQGQSIVYSGECCFVRFDNNLEIILHTQNENMPRFTKRKHLNPRVKLNPSPSINFLHPFCQTTVKCRVDDISGSGFSIIISDNESMFIPGLIIPDLNIELHGGMDLKCSAQVIYRAGLREGLCKYGISIVTISPHDQRCLFEAVGKAVDTHLNITGKVNLDSLWSHFFESGFIYQEKFAFINTYSEKIKETYRKLYEQEQDIFTHITYQENGSIYGHISTIKAYEDTWMIHHLSAKPMDGKFTGFKVLKQFIDYVDCVYRLPISSKSMLYNLCYYRPDNKFPEYVFGGIYRRINRRKVCSLDLFAYLTFNIQPGQELQGLGWAIEYFSNNDLNKLKDYYESHGGGLMLDAFCLPRRAQEINEHKKHPDRNIQKNTDNSIEKEYMDVGLLRKCKVYSLKENLQLKAVLIVDQSDLGINMSELLNSIKIIILEDSLPWEILRQAVSIIGIAYESNSVPVLIYPTKYLEQHDVVVKKKYNLWVIDTDIDGHDMDIIKDHARMKKSHRVSA